MNEKRFSFVSMSGFRALMCAVLVAVGLAACSDKDDNPVVNPQLVEQIQGNWIAINDFWGEDDDAYFESEDFEDIDPSIFDAHREVVYVNFDEFGNGSFLFFAVDGDNEPVGGEGDGLQLALAFDYTVQPDGSIKITSKAPINGFEENDNFRFRYENGSLIADDGKQQFTLHRPSQAEDAQMTTWKIALGIGGASADNYNINDEDFTAENWRKQEAIYIYDGKGMDATDAKGRTGYTLVNLPWYDGEKQTNLPYGFCDRITPENGWEWVLNRCGSRNIVNNNFFAVYNKYTGILRFFYYMPENFATGNDHVWQVSLTDDIARKSLWGYGLPQDRGITDKSKIAPAGKETMINYVTPWVDMKSDDGLIVPNAGWWAFDVDLSQYRPGTDISKSSIKLQMRSWNTSHVSLYSTLSASIDGSMKEVVKKADTSGDVAKGVMTGLQAAATFASSIAHFKADEFGNAFGAIGSLFGCGSEFAGIFGSNDQPFEAEISLGMKGTINTEGVIKGSVPTVGVASPTFQMKDFITKGTHVGEGVWNIKWTPEVYVFSDVKIDAYVIGDGLLPQYYYAIPYFYFPMVEFELNSNVFPKDQIEWVQCEATCVASSGSNLTGTDKYRVAFGLDSRNPGTTRNNCYTKTIEGYSLDYVMKQGGVTEIFNFMNYYDSWMPNTTKYPIQVSGTGNKAESNAKYIKGCGVNNSHAFEPALFIQRNFLTSKQTDAVNIEMPPLEVNVTLVVKMKNMNTPIELSRNYLPKFHLSTREDMEQWVRNVANYHHDYGFTVKSSTLQYQKDRVQKLYEAIKKY